MSTYELDPAHRDQASAKGRNGWFVPVRVDVGAYEPIRGQGVRLVSIDAEAARSWSDPPLTLTMTAADAKRIGRALIHAASGPSSCPEHGRQFQLPDSATCPKCAAVKRHIAKEPRP